MVHPSGDLVVFIAADGVCWVGCTAVKFLVLRDDAGEFVVIVRLVSYVYPVMIGLDVFLARSSSGLFWFLLDSYVGGGWGRSAVDVRVVHGDGVICRGFSTGDVFFEVFFCVGVPILWELLCAVRVLIVINGAGMIALDMVPGVGRMVLTLQVASVWNWLVRLLLHLPVCTGRCSSISLAGLLLGDWAWPVRRLATEPGECEDCPGRLADSRHAFGVLMMGFKNLFADSGSGLEFHPESVFVARGGDGSACGKTGQQRRRSVGAPVLDFYVFFSFIAGALFKGMDVTGL